jgi:hypothetical protein
LPAKAASGAEPSKRGGPVTSTAVRVDPVPRAPTPWPVTSDSQPSTASAHASDRPLSVSSSGSSGAPGRTADVVVARKNTPPTAATAASDAASRP